ncbi:uncharacterized protein F4822DRAFT_428941 [Hypoxylon trugodes]|uniref:uncharacterized protein n=1 Tax=Hypoxylon trugodes TaxID=326681 RepID=UPI00219FE28D|nr:uncharacterized protein F4822DRAFT_428941 [Hypoxylon trugodes]KAI1388321.1 hypothetical protein F4822DRAFT_428941 [Hypoxylon trugodes]
MVDTNTMNGTRPNAIFCLPVETIVKICASMETVEDIKAFALTSRRANDIVKQNDSIIAKDFILEKFGTSITSNYKLVVMAAASRDVNPLNRAEVRQFFEFYLKDKNRIWTTSHFSLAIAGRIAKIMEAVRGVIALRPNVNPRVYQYFPLPQHLKSKTELSREVQTCLMMEIATNLFHLMPDGTILFNVPYLDLFHSFWGSFSFLEVKQTEAMCNRFRACLFNSFQSWTRSRLPDSALFGIRHIRGIEFTYRGMTDNDPQTPGLPCIVMYPFLTGITNLWATVQESQAAERLGPHTPSQDPHPAPGPMAARFSRYLAMYWYTEDFQDRNSLMVLASNLFYEHRVQYAEKRYQPDLTAIPRYIWNTFLNHRYDKMFRCARRDDYVRPSPMWDIDLFLRYRRMLEIMCPAVGPWSNPYNHFIAFAVVLLGSYRKLQSLSHDERTRLMCIIKALSWQQY